MKLFFKFIFTLATFSSASILAETKTQKYLIEVGKINLGEMVWQTDIKNDTYSIKINLKNKGFLTSIYKFSGSYEVLGSRINNNLFPSKYIQRWKTNKKRRNIEISFKENKVDKITQDPFEQEHQRTNYKEKEGLKDPLSSLAEIILNKKQSQTIDGRRLYLMKTEPIKKNNFIKINITEYKNIWSDHKRLDLEYIELHSDAASADFELPKLIKIKFKGLVYKVTKI